MTQLGEAVQVGQITVDKHKDDTCPFCAEDEPDDCKNSLGNSASTLGRACKMGDVLGLFEPGTGLPGSLVWSAVYEHPQTGAEDICQVRSNPHHCIPGKASLKGDVEHAILEAMEVDKGTITSDIGYDVNGVPNGVWLPTIIEDFYNGYPTKAPVAGLSWGELTKSYPREQFSMAEAAMLDAKRQFHDAHPDYNEHVKIRLDKLLKKLIHRKKSCPVAGPKAKPNVPPPFALVAWLNSLSRVLAGHLTGPPKRWKAPLFTSRHADALHSKLK